MGPLPSTIESVISLTARGKQAFSLAARNSIEQTGKVIIYMAAPAFYNWGGSIVTCQWFMLGLGIAGFGCTIFFCSFVRAGDLQQENKVESRANREDLKRIPWFLAGLSMLISCAFSLVMGFSPFLASYLRRVAGFSNQGAGNLLVPPTPHPRRAPSPSPRSPPPRSTASVSTASTNIPLAVLWKAHNTI